MENLSAYLKKFRLLISSNEDKTKIISEEVFNITNILIPTHQISIRGGFVFFNTKPIIKGELFMVKERIIEALKERGISNIKGLR